MKWEKTVAATRPRGNQPTRFHLHLRQSKYSRTCLNLIIFICALFWTSFSFLGAGRFLNHQPAVREGNPSFFFHLVDQPYLSIQTGSQYRGYPKLLELIFSALLARVSSGIITVLARGHSGDQRLSKNPVVQACEHSLNQDRFHWHRITLPNAIIPCLGYLVLGVFAALLLRSSGAHPEEPDFYLAKAHHIQQLCQEFQKPDFRIFAAILIAPLPSDQTTLHRKIVDSFHLFKIGAILEMDLANPNPRGVYRPIKHRVAETEVLTSQDLEYEAGETCSLNKGGEDTCPDVPTPSGRPTITWAPDPGYEPSGKSSQARMKAKRQAETEGTATLRDNFYPGVPSSDATSLAGTPTKDLDSGYLDPTVPSSSSSPGLIRTAIRKTRSSIFRHGSSQADAEIPPMPQDGLFSRATSSILRRNPNRREDAPLVADRSISNEESTISLQSPGPTNLRRVRNLEFEEQARAMGFDVSQNRFGLPEETIGSNIIPLSQVPTDVRLVRNLTMEEEARALGYTLPKNRFGLPEEIVDDGALPTKSKQRVSSDAGTMVGLVISDDEYDFSDDEVTVSDDAETVSEDHGLHSPPTAAKIPVPETEGGLDYLQDSSSDSMSWLTDCFTSSNIDLLKNFGTPPRVTTHLTHNSPTFKMTDETRNGLHNLGAPPMIGDFGTCEAEQVHNSWLDHSQQGQDIANEANKLRGEIRTLVEKFIAMCKAKDSEIQSVKGSEAAAVERVKVLEKILELHGIAFEGASETDNGFDLMTNTCGGQQTPTKTGFTSTSKGSNSGKSSRNRSSHKKSKSQEGGFFKSLKGATEPSLSALEKLTERSLLEANATSKDPDLAVKLKVSSRQLPPEAPKPASKDPVPKAKSGTSSILRRLSSLENLKRKDAKGSGSSDSKHNSTRNDSQNSHSSQSKDASLTSITEECSGGSKSPGIESGPPSYRGKVTSFSEDSSSPAYHQRHLRSSATLTGQYDPDLNQALAALTTERSQQQGSGAIPQGWEYMGASRNGRKGGYEDFKSMEEEREKPTGVRHVSHGSYNSSAGALVHEDQANLDEDRDDQVLRSNPPSRSPPACPGLLSYYSEGRQQYFERQEVHEEHRDRARAPTTPERFNLNKLLPEINPEEVDKEEGRKDGKKRGLRNLFTRK
jgi:hypothetical protein